VNEVGIFATFVILEIAILILMGFFFRSVYLYLKFIKDKNIKKP